MLTVRFLLIAMFVLSALPALASFEFKREFAPQEGIVSPAERPLRAEICLNGLWQFQPVSAPGRTDGAQGPPPLPGPRPDAWEKTPIRIPSPWNVNSFSAHDGGDYRCYPSYPSTWDAANIGWMRREFRLPADWRGKRIVLHFQAVAGDCEVVVNDKPVTRHFDSFMPFSVDVTDAVRWDSSNELRVGVRKSQFFDVAGKLGHLTYPTGSFWGGHIAGIWQDVYLLALPQVRVKDLLVKPLVSKGVLELAVELRNDTGKSQTVSVGGKVYTWHSLTGDDEISAPEPRWRLGDQPVLELPATTVRIKPHSEVTVNLRQPVGRKLALWTTKSPRLHGAVVELGEANKALDRRYVRFGWREFGIKGNSLLLNGEPIQALGDSWHFMGVPQMTRRYAYAWYRALRDANANAVRLHAQPFPSFYLDVADEMGIMVLDESAIWASHCAHNYDHPEIRERFQSHVEALVLRDRNHASVFGWSIANEINAALHVKGASKEVVEPINDWFGEIARRVKELDPTRSWISSDGDEDMGGRLPVLLAHYGDPNYYRMLAERGKPLGVGEAGCGYYGTPKYVAAWSGDRAYESFLGRMEGVAIEAYDLLARGQRPIAAYCSIFNLAWYGLKPLPIGLQDTSRPPELTDGIIFGRFIDGKPGVQPERLGPYSTTLNPGYDPRLPLYDPWPLFEAIQAAYAPGEPAPSRWDHIPDQPERLTPPEGSIERVGYVGTIEDGLYFSLNRAGVSLDADVKPTDNLRLLIVDGTTLKSQDVPASRKMIDSVLEQGGTVLFWGAAKESLEVLNALLPATVALTERDAVSLVHTAPDPLTAAFSLADLYFAEWPMGSVIMQNGLAGPLVEKGRVLLEACNTDWRRWNNRGENVKTGSVLRSELEAKAGGAALVEMQSGKGRVLVSNIQPLVYTPQHTELLRKLMLGLDVKLTEPEPMSGGVFDVGGYLLEALVIGSFGAEDYTAAIDSEFVENDTAAKAMSGDRLGDLTWQAQKARHDNVLDFINMGLSGPRQNCAAYVSFWLFSPRPLNELLAQPDVPRVDLIAGSDDGVKIWLNGDLLLEDRGAHPLTPDQHKCRGLALKQGWNHFLVKVIQAQGDWSFTARLQCSDPRFLSSLRSSLTEPTGSD